MRKISILFVFIMALFVYTGSALALGSYLSSWEAIYPNSTSDNISCQLCHQSNLAFNFNPYGNAISNANGTLTDRIRAVEGQNSDNDPGGFTNIEEIDANTQPGWKFGDNGDPAVPLDPEIQ